MKIMFVCSALQMSVEMIYLAPYMAQMPHEFIISPLISSTEREAFQATGSKPVQLHKNVFVDPIYLKSSNMGFGNLLNPRVLLNDSFSIFNVMRRSKPQGVICYYLMHAYPFAILKKILGFRLAVVAQGSDVNLDNSPLQIKVRKLVCRHSDLIFACSWSLKYKIEKEHKRNVTITPSSADSSFFRPIQSKSMIRRKWGIPPERRVILSASTLNKTKAVDLIIRSLLKLSSDDVNLLIAGDGVERKTLEQLTTSLGLQERVAFLGWKNRMELLELYNVADIYGLVSNSEGLPRTLIEAMACGCIPIVTDVGSTAMAVSDGFNGYIIKLGDIEKFTEKVNEVLSLPDEKRRLMQTRARQKVEEDFEAKKTLETMVNEITRLSMCQH